MRGAITGVAREGVMAALLTRVMILLFSRQLALDHHHRERSIPLAVLGSIIMPVGDRRDAQHHGP